MNNDIVEAFKSQSKKQSWPMRYRLRTLLILLGILPPAIAGVWLYPQILAAAVLTVLCLLAALLINNWLFVERKE